MELIERSEFLKLLHTKLENVTEAEGHCILISGEAGIGKTSLVRVFGKERKKDSKIYLGSCDALFTPHPLAPLYDVAIQMRNGIWQNNGSLPDRDRLFSNFFNELANQQEATVIVFDDIHWADEATLDFIKFLARRITHLRCLFILTYRDNEIHAHHPLRTLLGQLPPDSFTRIRLTPLSRQAVDKMAKEKGYKGDDVYGITGGNPFYVNEILASYSKGVPDNIKDSILSVYNRRDEKAKQVWQLLSVLPGAFEIKYLEKLMPYYAAAIENCLQQELLIIDKGKIFFKHELFRRTVEDSLSPIVRINLNKKVLDLLLERIDQSSQTERIIHHAKYANEYDLVVQYAPQAAKKAALVGAHVEACRLYLSAIEFYQGNDSDILLQFYEAYAYECYLTNQIGEAINYTAKALELWKEKRDMERIGNCLRFLSRLWWFDGSRKKAEAYAVQAIDILEKEHASKAKAMSYSNMSQLKMISDQLEECILWGEKAIRMAKELADDEILCHALNNVGTVQMIIPTSCQIGIEMLQQSLNIALENSYDEHAARAYINLSSNSLRIRDYVSAQKNLAEGIQYCEERDLDFATTYLLLCKAELQLETGLWDEASRIVDSLIENEYQPAVIKIGALVIAATIRMRVGEGEVIPLLLEAKEMTNNVMEAQSIMPAFIALLEYEWITGKCLIEKAEIDWAINTVRNTGNFYNSSEFAFWLMKARKQDLPLQQIYEGYQAGNSILALRAAKLWEKLGCHYKHALLLFEGDEADKRRAVAIIQKSGAIAVFEKLKQEMKASGLKSIPRGIRRATLSNTAFLTERELDVLQLLNEGLQSKEIAGRLFISPKTVDHHISSILFKLNVNSRTKAVKQASQMGILN
ncbi:MAG TPA: AAA family ATPase [Chitinophagaceae bacterium]|nr:AAA family ATPase [Chitinophagaceae bacterium]